jgi:hypothetical protein
MKRISFGREKISQFKLSQADIQFPKESLVTKSEIMAGSISSNIVALLLRKWFQALTAP